MLLDHGIVPEDELEVYEFGIEQYLLKLLHYGTMLAVGLCVGMLPHTILFIGSYSFLRAYAGGFHAGSRKMCYLISWVIIAVALSAYRLIPLTLVFPLSVLFLVAAGIIVLMLAPVGNPDKPLDSEEIKRFRIKCFAVTAVHIAVIVVLLLLSSRFALLFSISCMLEAVMLILGRIRLRQTPNPTVVS